MNYFRLGRIFGINVHVNWSWLIIFGLVAWSLSLTFGQIHHEWPVNLRWGMAMLAAILFFISVLAHELAHSLVAMARGVPVSNITLFMFGGVSNMLQEPSSPAEEFVITIVGPLTSLFLGGVCLVVGAGGMVIEAGSLTTPAVLSQLAPINVILTWLGSVNIMIGFFNMIPALPLDGGRIIRSLIWAISNDIRRSTRWTTWLGQGIAWIMILSGVVTVFGVKFPLLGGSILNGIWLILIGAFLNNAAVTADRQTLIEEKQTIVQVRSIMQTRVPIISSDTSLGDALIRNLSQPDGHTMFVTDGQDVVGMVAMQDVKKSFSGQWAMTTVGDIMTPVADLLYVTADEDITEAFERLQKFDMRHIPVMFNNRIVGLLHRKDVHQLLQLYSDPGL